MPLDLLTLMIFGERTNYGADYVSASPSLSRLIIRKVCYIGRRKLSKEERPYSTSVSAGAQLSCGKLSAMGCLL
jgi:hypothetical protein